MLWVRCCKHWHSWWCHLQPPVFCVIFYPHMVVDDQKACLCKDQGVPLCVRWLVALQNSSSPINMDVCYNCSSISHLFYVQTLQSRRAAIRNLCHKFFNDCAKVVQNAPVPFRDGASFYAIKILICWCRVTGRSC